MAPWRVTALAWVVIALGATLVATLHPRAPAWSARASSAQLLADEAPGGIDAAAIPADALLVDARDAAAYAAGHAAGAVHLDPEDWDAGFPALLMAWTPGQPIVIYCDGGGCRASQEVAARLRTELGTEAVHHLRGGWPALRDAGR